MVSDGRHLIFRCFIFAVVVSSIDILTATTTSSKDRKRNPKSRLGRTMIFIPSLVILGVHPVISQFYVSTIVQLYIIPNALGIVILHQTRILG